MRFASPGAADDLGQFLTPSVIDGDLVALPGLLLRLLAGPAEPKLDNLANMLRVVVDAEVSWDQLGDACGCPQLSSPAVSLGPLQEQLLEAVELRGVESRRATGVKFGSKLSRGFTLEFEPGIDGRPTAAEEVCDGGGMFALIDQLNGTAAPAFEFFCSSDRSHANNTELHGFLFSLLCWGQ